MVNLLGQYCVFAVPMTICPRLYHDQTAGAGALHVRFKLKVCSCSNVQCCRGVGQRLQAAVSDSEGRRRLIPPDHVEVATGALEFDGTRESPFEQVSVVFQSPLSAASKKSVRQRDGVV